MTPAAIGTESLRLVARFQAGETSAFGTLYRAWAPRVGRYFEAALRDPHAAEDATQQVFLSVFRALPRYRITPGRPFEAWLFRIARNRLISERRSRVPVEVTEPRTLAGLRDQTEALPGHVGWLADDELADQVAQLPRRQREVLALRYRWGLRNREIAALLGLEANNVGQLQHRALQALRKHRRTR